jgi:hypothetical protein
LIKASRVPAYGDQEITIAEPGVGRRQDAITVCTRSGGVRELRATQVRSRFFMIDNHPPNIVTMALQYADAEAARSAARTFRERIQVCGKQLREDACWVGESHRWINSPTTRGSARFTELVDKLPGHAGDDAGYFESIGLTRVGDRLMITVSMVYGQDHNVSLDPRGDPETACWRTRSSRS